MSPRVFYRKPESLYAPSTCVRPGSRREQTHHLNTPQSNRRSHVPAPSTCVCDQGNDVSAIPTPTPRNNRTQPSQAARESSPRGSRAKKKQRHSRNQALSIPSNTFYCLLQTIPHYLFFKYIACVEKRGCSSTVCSAVTSLFTHPTPLCGLNT